MRVALLNPPHSSMGSRIPDEQLPPLGLLSIGGPLIDRHAEAGPTVEGMWGAPQANEESMVVLRTRKRRVAAVTT